MNESEAQHLQALLRAKKDRLHQLELKEAMYGLDAPPHVLIEMEKLRGEIKDLHTQLEAPEKKQKAASRLETRGQEARPVPTPAKLQRPVNWKRVGVIAGVIAVLIALSVWLVPNAASFLSAWLSETPAVTPTSSPTHMPVIPTATPTNTPTPEPIAGATIVWDKDSSVMVYIPAGEFTMGSDEGDIDEQPVHTVYLDAFYIDKTEVTNAQYQACVEARACDTPKDTTYYVKANYAQHPVVWVDWYQAKAYCKWAGKRLPTEAEWEKAARGTDGLIYPWGNTFDGTKLNFADKNTSFDWSDSNWDDGYAGTAPVGSYPDGASPYGALDMAGNVWEWVADWYAEDYYGRSPSPGEYRVLRSGSYGGVPHDVRSTNRYYPQRPDDVVNSFRGFRCARGSP
jgi:formylglycine-generating enzyme required for sulfatase activity